MSARHRQTPSPAETRLRALVVGMFVILVLGFLFLRGDASEDDGSGGTDPEAAASSSTTTGSAEDPGTTAGDDNIQATTTTIGSPDPSLPPLQSIEMELVFEGFRQPTVLAAPDGDDRLFVAQRVGVIRILDENREMLNPAFLDISDRVLANGIEQGLLGLAFHPDYETNRRFFVYYTDREGRRQLSEFEATVSDPSRANPDSEQVIFEREQPPDATDIRHYGGNLHFGPQGYLWVSIGDGADSRAQGQDPNTFFGTIVRIDVDNGDPYAVPPDNPFVDGGGASEVWAYGLRNPWRFSIDPVDEMIYIADVGHADQEEVNVVPLSEGGHNFGWSDVEGTRCFHVQDCDLSLYTSPVLTYSHEEGLSITGGYVYRGEEIPELAGTYFYSDWVNQWIRSFKFVDGQLTEEKDWTEELGGPFGQVNTYGVDGHGELYLVTHGGQVYRFTAVR